MNGRGIGWRRIVALTVLATASGMLLDHLGLVDALAELIP